MLEFLYSILIAPIELLLSFIFEVMSLMTDSKSLVIVLLSLIVSILLVPIYNIFDYWQDRDRVLEKVMQPKIEMIKRAFKGQERFAMLKTAYRQFGYHPIYGVRNSLGFLLQIPFFIAAYQYLSYTPELQNVASGMFSNLSTPDQLIKIGGLSINALPIAMTLINLWSGFIYSKDLLKKDKIQIVVIAFVFLILLYNSASGVVLYWTFNNIFSLLKNVLHRYRPATKKVKQFMAKQQVLPYLAAALFLTIAFFYFPSKLVASDPGAFTVDNRQWFVINNYYIFLLLGLFFVFVLKYFFVGLTKMIDLGLFIVAIFAVLTANYNLFDTGAIDFFKIADITERLGPSWYRIMIDLLLVIGIICLYRWVKPYLKNIILLIAIAVFASISVIATLSISEGNTRKIEGDLEGNLQVYLPSYVKDMTTLSLNHQNIIVFMLDGFTNPLFGEVLKFEPGLIEDFSGFTWYSNTVAVGSNTYLGGSVIHGGASLAPYEINKREDSIDSITQEIHQGYLPLLSTLSRENYEINLLNMQYTDCKELAHLHPELNVCTEYYHGESDLNPYYLQKNIDKFPKEIQSNADLGNKDRYLPSIGLYYAMFYSLRERIYNNGEWIHLFDKDESISINYSYYAFLTSFIDLLTFETTAEAQYKYLNSGYTHVYWHMFDTSCHLSANGEYYEGGDTHQLKQNQFYTTYCAVKEIQKLVRKLKANHAWDNTALIFVSDHGFKGDMQLAEIFTDEGGAVDFNNYPGRPSSLLLVKDFANNQPFQESKILMSPADVPSIICQTLGGCLGIPEDPRLNPNANRKLIHTDGHPHPDRHLNNKYNLQEVWEVTGDMYQRKNWRRIDTKE